MDGTKGNSVRCPPRAVVGGAQAELFRPAPATPGQTTRKRDRKVRFNAPNPRDIYLGERRLDRYLESMGVGWAVFLGDFLRSLCWKRFEARYDLSGRSPYAPAAIASLILYGTMIGVRSLRGLEGLARRDVGAMFMTGGLCPDHATLGRFFWLHEESLTRDFFEDLTSEALQKVGSVPAELAGDGSIIEAASSRYAMIKTEAAQLAVEIAEEEAAASPADEEFEAKAKHAREVAAAAEARAEAQRRNGSKRKATLVSSTEPEAPVLKGKRGVTTPAYTPSVLADENRFIHGADVAQTEEISSLEPMLDQAERISPQNAGATVLLDGRYATGEVAQMAAERGLDVLAPPKQDKGGKYFGKQDFQYDPENDVYLCPGGQELTNRGRGCDRRRGTAHTRYAASTATCSTCPLRAQCIRSKTRKRRIIYRYDTDEAMDALHKVMAQPRAKKRLRKRKSMVEPVFSELRGRQGLNRFLRFGLAGVRLEFAVHAAAHNLRRLIAVLARTGRLAVIYALIAPIGVLNGLFSTDWLRSSARQPTRRALPGFHRSRLQLAQS